MERFVQMDVTRHVTKPQRQWPISFILHSYSVISLDLFTLMSTGHREETKYVSLPQISVNYQINCLIKIWWRKIHLVTAHNFLFILFLIVMPFAWLLVAPSVWEVGHFLVVIHRSCTVLPPLAVLTIWLSLVSTTHRCHTIWSSSHAYMLAIDSQSAMSRNVVSTRKNTAVFTSIQPLKNISLNLISDIRFVQNGYKKHRQHAVQYTYRKNPPQR